MMTDVGNQNSAAVLKPETSTGSGFGMQRLKDPSRLNLLRTYLGPSQPTDIMQKTA